MVVVRSGSVFGGGALSDETSRRQQDALRAIDKADPERILNDEAGLIDELVDRFRLSPPSADWDGFFRGNVEEKAGRGQSLRIFVPITSGDDPAWTLHPSRFYPGGVGVSMTSDQCLTFVIDGTNLTAAQVTSQVNEVREKIDSLVATATRDINSATQNLRSAIAQRSGQRKAALERNKTLSDQLDIPLRPTSPEKKVDIPVARKQIRLEPAPATERDGAADPQISDSVYEDVLRTIRALGNAFERIPRTSARFNEEELRDLILFVLNSNYEGAARGEVFNGAGKTDLLLPWQDRNAFIGECKVWGGQSKFAEAIDQLLGYTVWRDTKAALVVFIKTGEPTSIIAKADATLRGHRCFVSATSPVDASLRSDYVLHHRDDPQRHIKLALLPVPIRATGSG